MNNTSSIPEMCVTPLNREVRARSWLAVFCISLSSGLVLVGQSIIQFPARYSPEANEGSGSALVSVERTEALETVVTVDFNTSDDTAIAGEDYLATSGTVTFAAGETHQVISIPILNDGLVEGEERFLVTLSNPGTGAVLGSRITAAVRIIDNDMGLQFEFPRYWVREDEGSVLIGVVRSDDGEGAVSVTVSTENGTAQAALDYLEVSQRLTIPPGRGGVQLMTVPILNDGVREPDETFRLILSDPADGAVVGSPGVATVTIIDNDIGPHWLMPDPWSGGYWVAEDEGQVVLIVDRGQDVELPAFAIDYATQDGTAVSGEDYVGSSGTVHFAEGQTEQVLLIPILADDLTEKPESFQVTLSNPPAGMPFNARQAAVTVNILNATGHSGHVLESITASPGAGCTLTLNSRLPADFDDCFDLFCLEVSSDLRNWSSFGWVAKRNSQSEAVSCFDPEIAVHRFYRLTKTSCIVPVPPPTGPYRVGLTERVVTDETRRNRYSRSANSSFRIWLYYPAQPVPGECPSRFSEAWVRGRQYHCNSFINAPLVTGDVRFPIVLFSHGFSDNLAQFKDRAEELVSHGYVVASVDHFDTTATWLPQYGWLQGENRTDVPGLHDRVRDLEFILDQLAAWDVNDPLFGQRLDLKNVAVTGFSWGGMTAAEFCRRDPRVRAAVLLDAGGTSLTSRIDKPFMHLRAANNSSTTFFNAAATDAIWFQLAGSVHLSFDAFYWFENPVGNRAPEEISLTQRAYLLSFLDHYLKEKATSLHKGPSADWPRVINYRSK